MTSWQTLLFPEKPRSFPGMRWLNICLRSMHLVGIAGTGGGFLFSLPLTEWLPFWRMMLASGVLLSLLYLWLSAAWLAQLRGQVIVLKLLLLALAEALPEWRAWIFILIVVLSGVIAHAPACVRVFRLDQWLTGCREKRDC